MTNIEDAHLEIVAASHPGMAGKKNEDRYGVSAFLTGLKGDEPAVLAVLCDGIGGHRAGEVAAQMGVNLITETVKSSDGSQPVNTLGESIKRANHAIYEASLSDQGRKGMGTTCACAWVIQDRLYTANLGDSRIYLLREGHILQLTTDHTWLQEAFDAGIIDQAQGEVHPNAHVIRRYLGSQTPPQPDFRLWFFEGEGDAEALDNQGLRLQAGDVLLICSDGLTDLVTDQEIHALVKSTSFNNTPAALIDLANSRGGHDNITTLMMRVPSQPGDRTGKGRQRRRWVGCLAALIALGILAAAVYLGMRWWEGRSEPLATTSPTITAPLSTGTPEVYPTQLTNTPQVIYSPTVREDMATPRYTITPWPTHTSVP